MMSRRLFCCDWAPLTVGLVLLGLLDASRAETNQPLCRIIRVRDDSLVVYASGSADCGPSEKLKLPGAGRLEFTFAPADETNEQHLRLRFKLDGFDRDWREAGGEMRVLVVIHGGAGEVLSCRGFKMVGQSEGWQGRVDALQFHQRRESLTLPAGAEELEVLLTSEEWAVLGTAAITDFRVWHADASGQQENIWPDPKMQDATYTDLRGERLRYWRRGRSGANMALLQKLPPPAQGRALVLADEDIHIAPSWQASLRLVGKARGGEKLTFEWQEAFSVGTGARSQAHYGPLPPGNYVFRVRTVTPSGQPIGSDVAMAVSISQVLWKRPEAIALGFVTAGLATTASARIMTRRRLQARLDEAERRRRVDHERLRIAQDIHDDLGASLTHLSLLSQTAHEKIEPPQAAWEDIGRLRALTLNLTQKLDEIVWAVSPRHDTMESLVSYLTDMAEDFLGASGIHTRLHFPAKLPAWKLQPGLRHNVVLAIRESLNNVVKHAKATEVHLRMEILPDGFELTIEDNGCGFCLSSTLPPPDKRAARHGLGGIRNRIESLLGKVSIHSAPGEGARVAFRVPVNGA